MELTKEAADQLLKQNEEYKRLIAEMSDPALKTQRTEEVKRLVSDMVAAQVEASKPKPKLYAFGEEKADHVAVSFQKFLAWVAGTHPEIDRFKTAMSTTSAQGGYLIPASWHNEIANRINNFSQLLPLVNNVTMTTSTVHVNSFLTDLSVAWSTEAPTKSLTKPTFSQADLALHYIYALITATNEVFEDAIPELGAMLIDLVAQNIALELEQEFLEGTTFTGLSTAGINGGAMLGAQLAYNDLVRCVNNASQLEVYKRNSVWVMTRGALSLIMSLKDSANRPLWNMNMDNTKFSGMLLGYPVIISDQIADTTSAAGTTSIYFGDPKTLWLGSKAGADGQMKVLFNNLGITSSSTSVSENLFQDNKVAWRIEKRVAELVAVPAAWTYISSVK